MSVEKQNTIHPTAIIGNDVVLGFGNVIGPFVVITGDVKIGDNNYIGTGSIIGAFPEYSSLDHLNQQLDSELKGVILGDDIVIREYVQIHQGAKRPTHIGSNSFIMNQTYIAHDCEIGEGVTLASSVLLAGTVSLGTKANLGMGAKVHQGLSIGQLTMVGMGAVITQDIPDFVKAYGVPAREKGINEVGMKRAGFTEADIEEAKVRQKAL
jgi:UDP-N-acetylglucosamine acyltransferase